MCSYSTCTAVPRVTETRGCNYRVRARFIRWWPNEQDGQNERRLCSRRRRSMPHYLHTKHDCLLFRCSPCTDSLRGFHNRCHATFCRPYTSAVIFTQDKDPSPVYHDKQSCDVLPLSTAKTRHRATTSMYSLTFRVRVTTPPLCDPCLRALRVCVRTKMALYKRSSFPFLSRSMNEMGRPRCR